MLVSTLSEHASLQSMGLDTWMCVTLPTMCAFLLQIKPQKQDVFWEKTGECCPQTVWSAGCKVWPIYSEKWPPFTYLLWSQSSSELSRADGKSRKFIYVSKLGMSLCLYLKISFWTLSRHFQWIPRLSHQIPLISMLYYKLSYLFCFFSFIVPSLPPRKQCQTFSGSVGPGMLSSPLSVVCLTLRYPWLR